MKSKVTARDRRRLDQSVRALLLVSDWLNELQSTSVDGRALDQLGEIIWAVESTIEEAA